MELLQPGAYYHIYNHANGNENIFREDKNYHFFLDKYLRYIYPVADTLAYCLMPNHFHFLVKMKTQLDIRCLQRHRISGIDNEISLKEKTSDVLETSDVSKEIDGSGQRDDYNYSNNFKNLFQSYTKAVNKVYNRRGSLFNQGFKRKRITSDDFLRVVLIYIHLNPVLHGFCKTPGQWKYSSYKAYFINSSKTKVNTLDGISFFGDKENLLFCHKDQMINKYLEDLEKF